MAAAIAYGFEKDRDQKILVYDWVADLRRVCPPGQICTSGNSDYEVLAKRGSQTGR